MHTEICTECNPPKEFTKLTEGKAKMALAMHRGRTHTHRIKTPMSGYAGVAARKAAMLKRQQEAQQIDNGQQVEVVRQKRTYTKRAKPEAASVTINCCPQCGFDMKRLAVAMALAERMKS